MEEYILNVMVSLSLLGKRCLARALGVGAGVFFDVQRVLSTNILYRLTAH